MKDRKDDDYVEFPEGASPSPGVPDNVEELLRQQAGAVYGPPQKVKDLSERRKKMLRVQIAVISLAQILTTLAFFIALLVPPELFYIRAGSAFLSLGLMQGIGFLCYTTMRRNFILQERVYGPAVPGAYFQGTMPCTQVAPGSRAEELLEKQLKLEQEAREKWEKQKIEMENRLDKCFADFCGETSGFNRAKARQCVECAYKMDCMMATQQRVMQKIYRKYKDGDDWKGEED